MLLPTGTAPLEALEFLIVGSRGGTKAQCEVETPRPIDPPVDTVSANVTSGFVLRACFKIARGPAARDFGCGQGAEAGASPQRAVTAEPTQAADKRPAAQRVFAEKAGWLR